MDNIRTLQGDVIARDLRIAIIASHIAPTINVANSVSLDRARRTPA
mgnify:CR=1 FL=1